MLVLSFNSGAQQTIGELAALGAVVTAVVSARPPSADAPPVPHLWSFSDRAETTTAEFDAWRREPPWEFTGWLDRLDPARDWAILGNPFTHVSHVLGSQVHGWRRARCTVQRPRDRPARRRRGVRPDRDRHPARPGKVQPGLLRILDVVATRSGSGSGDPPLCPAHG
jgi:hypothetical protein